MMKFNFVVAIVSAVSTVATTTSDNDLWGEYVIICDPAKQQDCQKQLDDKIKPDPTNLLRDEFTGTPYAVFFLPGNHDTIKAQINYYKTFHGVGETADDVVVKSVYSQSDPKKGALNNFWRSIEGMKVTTDVTYAVSQAAPLRRMHITGNLNLSENGGYSSGGFMADVKVDGQINAGTQQQFIYRNTSMGGFPAGNWNHVFVNSTGHGQSDKCTDGQSGMVWVGDSTRATMEKPYVVYASNAWKLRIPQACDFAAGCAGNDNYVDVEIGDGKTGKVFVVKGAERDTATAAAINNAINKNKQHVIVTPGTYIFEDTIKIETQGITLLGLGMPQVTGPDGKTSIMVDAVDCRVSGFTLEAGYQSTTLLQVTKNGSSHSKPTALIDVFGRAGGKLNHWQEEGVHNSVHVDTMVDIQGDFVILDNVWLWRADHSVDGPVFGPNNAWSQQYNHSGVGIKISGAYVTAYGLFSEHHLDDCVQWTGEFGETFFFQSELAYDATPALNSKAGYRVGADVKNHKAHGVGVYSFFNNPPGYPNTAYPTVASAIVAPAQGNIVFENMITVALPGADQTCHGGFIQHVINNQGGSVTGSNGMTSTSVCKYQSQNTMTTMAKFGR